MGLWCARKNHVNWPRERYRTVWNPLRRTQKKRGGKINCRLSDLCENVQLLELKPNAELNLPLAEEEAIRKIAWRSESRIEGCAAGAGRAGNIVDPVVNGGYLRTVEDIEELAEYFNLGILFYRKPARDSQIDVLGRRHVVGIVWRVGKTERTV